MQITENFTLAEIEKSDTATKLNINNSLPLGLHENATRMCKKLEQVRALFDRPIIISSFYRCPELNAKVGGSKTSAHMNALACDFLVKGKFPHTVFDVIRDSNTEFDQLILESSNSGSTWIHISIAKDGETPRRSILYGNKTKDGSLFRVANG